MSIDLTDPSGQIRTLIQTYQRTDPRLYQALDAIAGSLGELVRQLDPVVKIVNQKLPAPAQLLQPDDFGYKLTPTTIRLNWKRPNIRGSFIYELRRGDNWDTAEFVLRTQSTLVDINPVPGDSITYLLRTLDADGNYSRLDAALTVTVALPNPVVIDGSVIDNNVLLKWSPSVASFAIDHYVINKGPIEIGSAVGTFATFFETIAGDYLYTITAVDIVGNVGESARVTLTVNQPPDYVLTDSRMSNFLGTRIGVKLILDPSIGG